MAIGYYDILQENDDNILLELGGNLLSEEEKTVSEGGIIFREDIYRKVGFRLEIVLPKPEIEIEFNVPRVQKESDSYVVIGEVAEYPNIPAKAYTRPYDDEEEMLTILAELI
jgi:hypothetical protein